MSEFHIHVDALEMSEGFANYLTRELGFWRSDFSGHPEGLEHFEPPHHLTMKVATGGEFRTLFNTVVSYSKDQPNCRNGFVAPIMGYVEGEFLAFDKNLDERPFDFSVKPPFRINKTILPAGSFRESEIHVVLDRDRTDPRILQCLLDMGLYTAYMPKPYGIAQIFTVQGSKQMIQSIFPALKHYLESVGGVVNCSIKEERVADWWMSEPTLRLPPVISSIDWR